MATHITITERAAQAAAHRQAGDADAAARAASPRGLPGWLWFVALWCGGVGAAMGLGFAFKVLMNLTLFAVK
ncbi:hypothetical protein [Paraburkholderia kururiensis]|uniref:DUF2474 domain-containing protein n=1 Tax=Paraburkholderia kururiensis TaxID=984307 RepID=A0ABZ0WKE3_9BURK|nr:hypothetical protein [Paraburkholderia kururiensis]WQD77825.1 hypothetical protein U0042_27965 [Paraburkholderia kururiensis]